MKSNILGYPRIGEKRELKKANESFWAGKISEEELLAVAENIRVHNWTLQKEAGVDLIPSNDFSLYDQMLDFSFTVSAIPERFTPIKHLRDLERYYALARGYQKDGIDITAMEMTKWFDTNYHYIVPEFTKDQSFKILVNKPLQEYNLAKKHGFDTKPVLIGLVTYLLLGKEKEQGFHRLDLADRLLPVYVQIVQSLVDAGAKTIQIDEPYLALDLPEGAADVYKKVYTELRSKFPTTEFILTTYFGALDNNTELAVSLPFNVLHIDLVRAAAQLDKVLKALPADKKLSLGVVDGRNIWKNNFEHSLAVIEKAKEAIGAD
ncbi:MAG: 5-methyltetrahydropteroyltriglutamate--homocysteine S-methyltransferase, partial [Capnocytophaga ochracea]